MDYENGKHEPPRSHLYIGGATVALALVWLWAVCA
jgi:hypothetical protein